MSLMKTLARVAIGVAIAKGVSSMAKGSASRPTSGGSSGGGSIFGGRTSSQSGGGLEDIMGDILSGGRTTGQPTGSGGLGGLLEELTGTKTTRRTSAPAPTRSGGGLDDLLGQLTGAGGSGGLGDILGGVLGGAAGGALGGALGGRSAGGASQGGTITPNRDASFGEVLNQSFGKKGEPQAMPTPSQDAAAGLMLRAMIQAAKSDGKIDAAEKEKLLGNLQDATEQELAFVKAELAAPVDVNKLVNQVPDGLEAQVYAMSVLAINLDNQTEAQYLHSLAEGLGLERQTVNQIHGKIGVPPLYS